MSADDKDDGPPWGLNPQFLLRIWMMMLPGPQSVPITAQGTQDKSKEQAGCHCIGVYQEDPQC